MRNIHFYAQSFFQTPGVVEASEEGFGGGVLGLILRASLPSQVVLLILIVFSVVSWAVILLKLKQFQSIQYQTASFIEVFRRSSKFSEVQSVCKSLAKSPLTGVFQAGYAELNAQLRQPDPQTEPTQQPDDSTTRPRLKSFDALDRALLRASTIEVSKLERRVPFLATTASITPFIGLLGTVWGIIIAFQRIGETGSTNLAVVAPRDCRSTHCHGGGTVRRDSSGLLLQPLDPEGEGNGHLAGRFFAGVPQHRREELLIG